MDHAACYATMRRLARLSYGVPLVAPYDDENTAPGMPPQYAKDAAGHGSDAGGRGGDAGGRGGNAGGQSPGAPVSQQPIWTRPQTPPKVGPRTIPQSDGTRNSRYSEYPPDWYAKDALGHGSDARGDDPHGPTTAPGPFDHVPRGRFDPSPDPYKPDPAPRPASEGWAAAGEASRRAFEESQRRLAAGGPFSPTGPNLRPVGGVPVQLPAGRNPFAPANAPSPLDHVVGKFSRDADSRNRYAADPRVRPAGRYAAPAGTHRYAEDVRLRSGEAAGYSSYPQDSFGRPRGVVDQIGMGDFTRGRFGYEEDGDADYARRRGPGR